MTIAVNGDIVFNESFVLQYQPFSIQYAEMPITEAEITPEMRPKVEMIKAARSKKAAAKAAQSRRAQSKAQPQRYVEVTPPVDGLGTHVRNHTYRVARRAHIA